MFRLSSALLLASCGTAIVAERPPEPVAPVAPVARVETVASARLPVSAASVDGPAGEPSLGSMEMALHLFAAPPPASLLAQVGPGPLWPASLHYPSPRRVVGRTFGSGPSRCHLALDLGAQRGDRVSAAESGTVAYVGPFSTGGLVVMVVHAGGFVTAYAHLSSSLVRAGDVVTRGQPIAQAGSSGNSNGTHLHFVLLLEGHPVDPLPLLEPHPTFVSGTRRFASAEKAAEAWRHCPAKGQRYEGR